jgi:CDP-Glycerol:Poly(glycerophosphate) glycerophosphotransferase
VTKRVWLVLPDPLPTRVFVDCGIASGLRERLGGRLDVVLLLPPEQEREWAGRLNGIPLLSSEALLPARPGAHERIHRRLDRRLDDLIGFYPLALRHSLRHGFHRERMQPGHANWFLDPERAGPLPRWEWVESLMFCWHFGRFRYVPDALLERMRRECAGLVVANLQTHSAVPFLNAARRLRLPVVGYVSSWDHPVGKGIVSPHLDRYVVQNGVMRDDLVRYHNIHADRVVVTGWPQTDVFQRRRPRADYEALLRDYRLDPGRRLVLVMGNTPTNAPYEARFVERLLDWWSDGPPGRFSLLFRPHPRDRLWRERFAAAMGVDGAYVQEPSYTDMDRLATLLQHGDCVVANAGTILLDSLVNDRPAVCVLYDEGAPPGERWAELNVVGRHYRELMRSDAFYTAERFDEVTAGIERALEHPAELADERRRVAREVVGEVDGRAAERVIEAVVEALGVRTGTPPV